MDAYVNHVFNTSVQDVFQEFERGFFQVCDRELVGLFRPEELQEFLVGKDVHDWKKLKQVKTQIILNQTLFIIMYQTIKCLLIDLFFFFF